MTHHGSGVCIPAESRLRGERPMNRARTGLASDFASIFRITLRGEVAVASPTLRVETAVRQSELKY